MLDNENLVEAGQRSFGRFLRTPIANPLDAVKGPARAFKWFRTKDWAGFTLIHPQLASSMIIQDAKYLATSEFYAGSGDELHQYSANRAPGLHLPKDLLHSQVGFYAGGYGLGYRFGDDDVAIAIAIDATKQAPPVHGLLHLDPKGASHPLVVSARLPGGGTMYTNKIVYPAHGMIACGDDVFWGFKRAPLKWFESSVLRLGKGRGNRKAAGEHSSPLRDTSSDR